MTKREKAMLLALMEFAKVTTQHLKRVVADGFDDLDEQGRSIRNDSISELSNTYLELEDALYDQIKEAEHE